MHINFNGMKLANGMLLTGSIFYNFVRMDDGQWRVSTQSYQYELETDECPLFAIHWHPNGTSPYKSPHIHIRPHSMAVEAYKAHYPTARLTFEDAVEWAIALGAQPSHSGWSSILETGRNRHIEHRSWHHTGSIPT